MELKKPKKSLRILLICKSLPDTFKGGIQTHVWALSKWMQIRGHEVTILAGGSFKRKAYEEELEGRRIIRIPFFPGRKLGFLSKTMEEIAFCYAAYRWLKKHGQAYDIIHGHGRSGAWIPQSLSEKVACISTFHGLIQIENEKTRGQQAYNTDSWLHERWARWLENRILRMAKTVIFISRQMKQSVEEYYGTHQGEFAIIPNGIDDDDSAPYLNGYQASRLLVFVGRLDPIKGLFPLLTAMKGVNPAVKLVLVGDGPARTEIEQIIAEQGLESRVILTGSQDKEAVNQWINKSFALILPSFYETQGIVLMEANILGKPVLTSDIGGTTELVKHGYNGLVFQPGSVSEMARAINSLYNQPELARKMGENGRRRMLEEFNWQKIAEDTEMVYFQSLIA